MAKFHILSRLPFTSLGVSLYLVKTARSQNSIGSHQTRTHGGDCICEGVRPVVPLAIVWRVGPVLLALKAFLPPAGSQRRKAQAQNGSSGAHMPLQRAATTWANCNVRSRVPLFPAHGKGRMRLTIPGSRYKRLQYTYKRQYCIPYTKSHGPLSVGVTHRSALPHQSWFSGCNIILNAAYWIRSRLLTPPSVERSVGIGRAAQRLRVCQPCVPCTSNASRRA